MNRRQSSSRLRGPGGFLLGLLVFLLLLTLNACGGSNNAVHIYDNARVLNGSKVQNAASNLSNPIAIYTTNTFQGDQATFQRTAIQKLNGNPNLVVMAIDTNHRYIYIARGSNVPLSSTGINQAVNAFSGNFNGGDYTNASVAALNSLQNSLNTTSTNRSGSGFNPLIPCLLLPLLLILGGVLFAASKRNRMRSGMVSQGSQWQPTRGPQPTDGPYTDPNAGYGPYNQGYSPNQRGSGLNPWAAGGLGAAAGGIAGYELGKRAGDREENRSDVSGNDFGSGGGGSFGGNDPNANFDNGGAGGGGFFGGGDPNTNFDSSGAMGSGGSFGGGDSGDAGGGGFFGGGGDSGGSGGGGFFGGGGNDDFSGGGNSGGGGNF